MARDCLQPWMDRLAHAELETEDLVPHSAFVGGAWDDQRLGTRTLSARAANPDRPVLPARLSRQVGEDPGWETDDFEFAVASY
ncbi:MULTISPECIES: hypothetical protein [Myxococcus]|uniref:Uncharacterized protein n=1 Tax=Myxococcus llanfairpwllgwyngyllgogerychwyrndrobwllllantysiliogogogochensis TaxID=2590453 RepID=A0A540WMT5_9BACT|nr:MULTISPECIES: hypothetical protein [Myxococcus]NTX04415.1 hypothetical protein [Myxococcus sp. CA040A]NTX36580.1 hypothetical protein [Myxococcus sp. CA033]TQF10340.1 hypothetical protein FJV41_39980 [Myxococcus llanfairpwllgwyngyllgogerychwyrndrobwllllantysiliogogogochensis]